ncbi:MAG: hypothetical protein WCN98_20460 [Verrucomicrobiaceae bacterium]
MKRVQFYLSLVLPLLSLGIGGCSHPQKNTKPEPRLAERLGKWDMTKRSSFEKAFQADQPVKGVKTGSFHTANYNGTKDFTSANGAYRTKDFQQGSKSSNVTDKSFKGAKDDKQLANAQYKTTESRMNQKASKEGAKNFAGSDKAYQTKDEREAAKSMKKNNHPVMVDTGKPSYTEDEVRGLLNKN